ncbi:MAG TPA: hypothetical protein VKF40_21605 [Burkholderiales bacterium]|nr:hypothetical protein [Burkholderiales bacterium]
MITKIVLGLVLAVCAVAPMAVAAADQPAATGEKRSAPVGTGEIAPEFTLEDQEGRSHALSAERGKRPVVLVFYRGYW